MNRLTHALTSAALALGTLAPGLDAGGLLVASGEFGGKLTIERHQVDVTIRDGIAVTTFEEVFKNQEDRVLEALYTFPVPEGASVANFSMWIDGKEMVGEVVERERARQIYESYKPRRVDPGLLEQVDEKRFEMRIFPIQPKAEQRIRVTYYQELDFDADTATYVYPLATGAGTERADTRVHGEFSLDLDVLSEIPIVSVASPSHGDEFVWVEHDRHYRQASLEQATGDLSRDVVLRFKTKRARTGMDLVASKPEGEDGFFQVTLTAGDELAQAAEGMDYVFLSDISGSMKNAGKRHLSVRAVEAFTSSLSELDRMQVLSFNVATNRRFDGLQPVGKAMAAEAIDWLRGLTPRGGTSLVPALRAAYGYQDPDRTLNVVVLSDGLTDEPDLLQGIAERPAGIRVFCIGVGNDVNRPLLDQLARESGGLADFVSHADDFGERAEAFRRKLARPALENVQLAFEGGGTYETTAARIGNLFHGSPVRAYGRYSEAGVLSVRLTAFLNGNPFEQEVRFELPNRADDHPEIERMWAYHRIQMLEDSIRNRRADDGTIGEIVMLSEGFSIPSLRASFLVLENDAEFARWKIDRRNATRIQRDRKARERLRDELLARREFATATNVEPESSPSPAKPTAQPVIPLAPRAPARVRPTSSRSSGSGSGSWGLFGALLALLLMVIPSSDDDEEELS